MSKSPPSSDLEARSPSLPNSDQRTNELLPIFTGNIVPTLCFLPPNLTPEQILWVNQNLPMLQFHQIAASMVTMMFEKMNNPEESSGAGMGPVEKQETFICANPNCKAVIKKKNLRRHPITFEHICNACRRYHHEKGVDRTSSDMRIRTRAQPRNNSNHNYICSNKVCKKTFNYWPRHHPITKEIICAGCCVKTLRQERP